MKKATITILGLLAVLSLLLLSFGCPDGETTTTTPTTTGTTTPTDGGVVVDVWESDIYWREEYVIKQVIGAVGSTFVFHVKGPQLDHGIVYSNEEWSDKLKNIWFKISKGRPKKEVVIKKCLICEKEFKVQKVNIYKL